MSMKIALTILIVILAVLACGCTTEQQATVPPAQTTPAIPDLVGTWTGPMQGYDENGGFTDYGGRPMSMVVTEQQGRIFAGQIQLTWGNKTYSTPMTGIIASNGKTFSMVEKDNGYTTGEIVSADTIELTWRKDSTPFSAALDTLKRG